jgi:chromate reductase, NAD(P)H dehydrogenase (quinone)
MADRGDSCFHAGMAKIVLICGTNRPGSNTSIITAHLDAIYRALGQPVQVLDLHSLPPEIFAPTSYGEKPASFKPFSDAVLGADGVHIITPEYNGGMPGVLKYFIDMLKFPESFERKPVAFTGLAAGMWGALRPVEQLQAIFGYRNAHLYPERVFIPGVNDHLTPEGRLGNEEILGRLRSQAEGFVKFVGTFATKS